MQPNSDSSILEKITYLTGNADIIREMPGLPAREPFSQDICDYLSDVSRKIMRDPRSRAYSDVITLGFWLRKASVQALKDKYYKEDKNIHLGRGLAFHIAPSNVPVNFAYSLVTGMLTGNSNIVRIPSKDFPQVEIIVDAFNQVMEFHENIRHSIALIRYGRDKDVNDLLSGMADIRVIWGGDQTIADLRKSPIPPRCTEITFADRYSLAVIDSDSYLKVENVQAVAQDFYNDTYFSDQNACTSPRIIVWTGQKKEEAKEIFWTNLHKLVQSNYNFQTIQGINKLTSGYLMAVHENGTKLENQGDNLIVRARIPRITEHIMDLKDNCGYFFEYDCDDIMDIKPLCDDKRCQTVGVLGDKSILTPLLKAGIKGIDRITSFGKTMDFDLIWDGYDLLSQMTRTICID